MNNNRFELVMPALLRERGEVRAKELGITLSEYIKDLMKADLEWVKNVS